MTTARTVSDRVFLACGLAWAVGLIHLVATIEHVREYALYAVFFALLAPAQLAWGAALYRHGRRWLLWVGAAASLAVVAVWVVSRTSGMPLGPDGAWRPEPVGPLDAVATADEIALALILLLELSPARSFVVACRRFVAGASLPLLLISAMTLVLVGHNH